VIDGRIIIRRCLEELGRRELDRVRGTIGSKTLRAALRLVVNANQERADLFIPHYWAVYYHDGRGAVSPVSAQKLVFFANPNDDPRGRTPEREAQVRRLTKAQYHEGLRINRERRAAGREPFMFVVDSVGPAAPHPFFDRLEKGAAKRADGVVRRIFERELLRQLDVDPFTRSETRVASFRLRG